MLRLLPVNTLRVPTKTSWFPVPPLAYRLARRPFPVVFLYPGMHDVPVASRKRTEGSGALKIEISRCWWWGFGG
jgi:hypothetical protein